MGEEELEKLINPIELDGVVKSKSGTWPQVMIFFNGIILTIAATITLFIYVDRIQFSQQTETIDFLTHDIIEKITHVVEIVDAFSYSDFKINSDKSMFNDIDSVTHVSRVSINEKWRVSSVYNDQIIKSSDLKNIIKTNKKISFFTNKNEFLLILKRGANDFYIAKINPDFINNIVVKKRYKIIHRIQLFDPVNEKNHIQSIEYISANKDVRFSNEITQDEHEITIFDKSFKLTVDIVMGNSFFLSDKMPFIILLFGAAMTLIGTLFVRNNQKQSRQMVVMNDILAEKNDTLESKIEEVEGISKALLVSEDEYKSAVNSVQDILFELDMSGRIMFLNNSWKRITNISIDEAYEQSIFRFFHFEDRDKIQLEFFNFKNDKKFRKINVRLQSSLDEYRLVEITFSVIKDNTLDGTLRVMGTIIDVEEIYRTEQALDETEKRYRKIVENSEGGIYQISPDGKIMNSNPAFLHILGYETLENMTENNFNIRDVYLNAKDRQTYETLLFADGNVRNYEVQIRNSNGRVIWINENAHLVKSDNGEILYYEGSIEDITQRKEVELALIEAKLNSDLASRAKSEFLANMSHELRTPLNAIIGFSEIIKGEALGEIEQKQYVEYAGDIHGSGTRLLNVINEILGISKIEAGNRQLNESIVDLKNITQTCVDLLAGKIENRQLQVNNLIDEDIPNIVGEELAFKQILMNLLSNAIKFTPPNGTITLFADYNGDDLRLSITDTGIGIEEADISKALSPFGQLDNSLSRAGSGTGLGLTLVDSLIRLHDGSMELISQKGFGTTVTLVIPQKRIAVKKIKKTDSGKTKVTKLSDYKNK